MRTHEFEFKKTIKRVKKFKAISIDLTVAEAKEVIFRLRDASEPEEESSESGDPQEVVDEMMWNLLTALESFVAKHE